jgi:hypothetical protein
MNKRNLSRVTTTLAGDSNGLDGIALDFGAPTIPEDGAYAFNFRLYCPMVGVTGNPTRCVFYIQAFVDGVLADEAEINIYAFANINNAAYTYTVALGCNAKAGQNIIFKAANYPTSIASWTLGSSSSMIWWKL